MRQPLFAFELDSNAALRRQIQNNNIASSDPQLVKKRPQTGPP